MSNAGCPSGRFLPLERRSDGEVPDPRGFPGILGKAVTILQADRPDRQIDAYAEPHAISGDSKLKPSLTAERWPASTNPTPFMGPNKA